MIPELNMRTVCSYATSTPYCEPPSEEQLTCGVVPLDSLPAAWWNWMWNQTNAAIDEAKTALNNMVCELNTVLNAANIPAQSACLNQLYCAIDKIRQTVATASTAGAVKSSSDQGKVGIDANGIMTANGVGNTCCICGCIKQSNELVASLNKFYADYTGNLATISGNFTSVNNCTAALGTCVSCLNCCTTDLCTCVGTLNTNIGNLATCLNTVCTGIYNCIQTIVGNAHDLYVPYCASTAASSYMVISNGDHVACRFSKVGVSANGTCGIITTDIFCGNLCGIAQRVNMIHNPALRNVVSTSDNYLYTNCGAYIQDSTLFLCCSLTCHACFRPNAIQLCGASNSCACIYLNACNCLMFCSCGCSGIIPILMVTCGGGDLEYSTIDVQTGSLGRNRGFLCLTHGARTQTTGCLTCMCLGNGLSMYCMGGAAPQCDIAKFFTDKVGGHTFYGISRRDTNVQDTCEFMCIGRPAPNVLQVFWRNKAVTASYNIICTLALNVACTDILSDTCQRHFVFLVWNI